MVTGHGETRLTDDERFSWSVEQNDGAQRSLISFQGEHVHLGTPQQDHRAGAPARSDHGSGLSAHFGMTTGRPTSHILMYDGQ